MEGAPPRRANHDPSTARLSNGKMVVPRIRRDADRFNLSLTQIAAASNLLFNDDRPVHALVIIVRFAIVWETANLRKSNLERLARRD
jgi:hypothetical protein